MQPLNKLLVAAGCSFTHGEDTEITAAGVSIESLAEARYLRSWPFLYGRDLYPTVVNVGDPGASNARIFKNAYSAAQAHSDKQLDIIIMLSAPQRIEFPIETHTGEPGWAYVIPQHGVGLRLPYNIGPETRYVVPHRMQHRYTISDSVNDVLLNFAAFADVRELGKSVVMQTHLLAGLPNVNSVVITSAFKMRHNFKTELLALHDIEKVTYISTSMAEFCSVTSGYKPVSKNHPSHAMHIEWAKFLQESLS